MNSKTILESMSYIDDELLERSEAPTRKKERAWLRAAAACLAVLAVLGAVIGTAASAKANNAPDGVVYPPSQTGAYSHEFIVTSTVSYNNVYSLKSMYEEAQAVALVTIGNWLGENSVGTYFEATVDKLYKGELPQTILLYQLGNSYEIVEGSPLYTYGDRVLVGLLPWDREEEYPNSYESVGSDIAFLYAADADGETYLLDHKGWLSRTTREECGNDAFTYYAGDRKLVKKLCKSLAKYDKVIAEQVLTEGANVYSLKEVEEYFKGLD